MLPSIKFAPLQILSRSNFDPEKCSVSSDSVHRITRQMVLLFLLH